MHFPRNQKNASGENLQPLLSKAAICQNELCSKKLEIAKKVACCNFGSIFSKCMRFIRRGRAFCSRRNISFRTAPKDLVQIMDPPQAQGKRQMIHFWMKRRRGHLKLSIRGVKNFHRLYFVHLVGNANFERRSLSGGGVHNLNQILRRLGIALRTADFYFL